jgi:hypothetical protein
MMPSVNWAGQCCPNLCHSEGPFDFALTGILASVTGPLAEIGVGIFAISTFDTDYLLLKQKKLPQALEKLAAVGHYIGFESPNAATPSG